ncbi:MAG: hypothetical protein WCR30_02755 [Clostridia bacterium]
MNYLVELSDKRNAYVFSDLLSQGLSVKEFIFGLSQCEENDKIVFSPAKKLSKLEAESLPNSVYVFGGNVSEETKEILSKKNIKYTNLISDQIFAYKNAMLTAEGVLALIIGCNEKSIFESSILILGGGRVAKAIVVLFGKLGFNVAIQTYNENEYNESLIMSKKSFLKDEFSSEIGNFDIIINTIPKQFLTEEILKKIKKETVIFEVASINCLNVELLPQFGFKYIPSPSLPQKYCSKSAAKIMVESILKG